ncbi:TonB-dependent Receptor Plug Domain [Sphingopyxis sp. YR583]|uniref:TonB-dependent receptor domain-containing protein n=1 Tax=Sphingopyxis sp. YR583 TaxID=1881047 RepID=UPI0008A74942|nr:TonB-dependent receptor [Sphingopyxis sp. YR583]SEH16620.1 TonB-dependent Receptor Plug Domain [Sphingopyxis sp. YR583]
MKKIIDSKLRLGAAPLVLGLALVSTPAFAQDAAEEGASSQPEIVVTGTLIRRPDLTISSPVTVVGTEEIQYKQPNTAEDLLRDLPSVRPALGPAVNNGGDGSSQVDLRGLNQAGSNSSQRTLVLLDGRRIVPFGLDGFTDLNNIPIALVERVDVLTGGASTVYGADAVAGAVNFVTKRNFTGLDASASYRITERGDGQQFRADVVMGASFDDDRGNVVLALGYTDRKPVFSVDREVGRFPRSIANGNFQGATAAVPTIIQGSPSNAALGLAASDFGAAFDPVLGVFRPALQSDTYNTNEFQYVQAPLERFNVYAQARYEISDNVEAYASGMFTRNSARIQLASTGTFSNPFVIPISNAYLPVAARNQLCGAIGLTAAQCTAAATATSRTDPNYREVAASPGRRIVEFGARGNQVDSNQFQIQGGLRGNITETLRYDVFGQYGETTQNQTRENWGSYSRLQQALLSRRDANNNPVCYDTSNGCVPINLFGPLGSINSDMLNFIDLDAQIRRVTKLSVVGANISGDLFGISSPFSDKAVAFSLGVEHRNLSSRSNPDAPSRIQSEVLGTGARTPADFGRITVKEIFGELIVPIVEDKPFFYDLSLEAGLRYSDYNTTGTSTTWKAGGSWEPVRGYKIRGMYQVAARSPNIQELFQSPVTGLNNLGTDPCQASQLGVPGSPTANPQLAALCQYTGAPAASIGNISSPTSGQINATTSGNPNLDVERAKTWTLGVVLQPSFVPSLALTVDYFNIKVKDAISNPAAGDILNGCYSTALNPSQTPNAFCDLIKRSPNNGSLNGAGETPGVILAGSNLGQIETAGIDLGLTYRLDLGEDSGLRFSFNGTWLDYYHFQATPNAINRDCTGYYSTNCTNPRAEWKWNSRLTYSNGPFDISLMWNHISSVRLEPAALPAGQRPALDVPQTAGPNPANIFDAYERIKAYDYFDLTVAAEVNENFTFTFGVENLFDKKPPVVGATIGGTAFNNANTFPSLYDTIGRSYSVTTRLKF